MLQVAMIECKRVYDGVSPEVGTRVLVDRLWPRGISKEEAALDAWLKEIAPSNELRSWFGHDPDKWEEFCRRYHGELDEKRELVDTLLEKEAEADVLVLVYAAKDREHNNAVALKDYLEAIDA